MALFTTENQTSAFARDPENFTGSRFVMGMLGYKPNGQKSLFGKIKDVALPVIGGIAGTLVAGPAGATIGSALGQGLNAGSNRLASDMAGGAEDAQAGIDNDLSGTMARGQLGMGLGSLASGITGGIQKNQTMGQLLKTFAGDAGKNLGGIGGALGGALAANGQGVPNVMSRKVRYFAGGGESGPTPELLKPRDLTFNQFGRDRRRQQRMGSEDLQWRGDRELVKFNQDNQDAIYQRKLDAWNAGRENPADLVRTETNRSSAVDANIDGADYVRKYLTEKGYGQQVEAGKINTPVLMRPNDFETNSKVSSNEAEGTYLPDQDRSFVQDYKSPDYIRSVSTHETTHDAQDALMNAPEMVNALETISGRTKAVDDPYLTDPKELQSRLMQMREAVGQSANQPFRRGQWRLKNALNTLTLGLVNKAPSEAFRQAKSMMGRSNVFQSLNDTFAEGGESNPGPAPKTRQQKVDAGADWVRKWVEGRAKAGKGGLGPEDAASAGWINNPVAATEQNPRNPIADGNYVTGSGQAEVYPSSFYPESHSVHEATHNYQDMAGIGAPPEDYAQTPVWNQSREVLKDTPQKPLLYPDATQNSDQWSYDDYIRRPGEVHSRIMQVRHRSGFKPGDTITQPQLDKALDQQQKHYDVKQLEEAYKRGDLLNLFNKTVMNQAQQSDEFAAHSGGTPLPRHYGSVFAGGGESKRRSYKYAGLDVDVKPPQHYKHYDDDDKTSEDIGMYDLKTGEHYGKMRYGERILTQNTNRIVKAIIASGAPEEQKIKAIGERVHEELLTHKDIVGNVGSDANNYAGGNETTPGDDLAKMLADLKRMEAQQKVDDANAISKQNLSDQSQRAVNERNLAQSAKEKRNLDIEQARRYLQQASEYPAGSGRSDRLRMAKELIGRHATAMDSQGDSLGSGVRVPATPFALPGASMRPTAATAAALGMPPTPVDAPAPVSMGMGVGGGVSGGGGGRRSGAASGGSRSGSGAARAGKRRATAFNYTMPVNEPNAYPQMPASGKPSLGNSENSMLSALGLEAPKPETKFEPARPQAAVQPEQSDKSNTMGNLLDIGRIITGGVMAGKKAPVYSPDGEFQRWQSDVIAQKNKGFTSPESNALTGQIADTYNAGVNAITQQTAGMSPGVGLSALTRLGQQRGQQTAQMAQQDAQLRRYNQQAYGTVASQIESDNRDRFATATDQVNQSRQAGAALVGSAIDNIQQRGVYDKNYGPRSLYARLVTAQADREQQAADLLKKTKAANILSLNPN